MAKPIMIASITFPHCIACGKRLADSNQEFCAKCLEELDAPPMPDPEADHADES